MREKRTFLIIFALFTIFLMVLPFLVTFNDFLTSLVEKFGLYMWVQERVVPLQVKMVGAIVQPLGVDYTAHRDAMTVGGVYARMTWNCIGWQSLLLFLISAFVGLRGSYTLSSRIEALTIGLLGTILINLLRMAIIVVILNFSRPLFAVVFHDYLAAIVTIIWLVFYWWFAYSYVLREKVEKRFV
jgi:exosortase/archaeosortase family protein